MQIKIRFIERLTPSFAIKSYLIQRKTIFGWKYIGYWESGGSRDSVYTLYCEDDKAELLKKVIESFYKSNMNSVLITEYPSLKVY